ncbi:hypothetical protein CDAR_564501 [Caerostris darwini]|uniref:Uncharacterized protein n=1 Tax=Caerostris darwini TaxID=1538125 RepID=A0AAV4THW0_9ARAC|nr:hypothetical protein CDAR_564501 [Caerostris darwini]
MKSIAPLRIQFPCPRHFTTSPLYLTTPLFPPIPTNSRISLGALRQPRKEDTSSSCCWTLKFSRTSPEPDEREWYSKGEGREKKTLFYLIPREWAC